MTCLNAFLSFLLSSHFSSRSEAFKASYCFLVEGKQKDHRQRDAESLAHMDIVVLTIASSSMNKRMNE